MTRQHFVQDINASPSQASVTSSTLGGTQQGTTDTAVFNFVTITTTTADDYTVTTTAANGTTIAILKPGTYIATLVQSVNAANTAIGISLGGIAAPFNTTPAAIGGNDGIIALKVSVANDASVLNVMTSFRIDPSDIDGTQNVVRFMGIVGGVYVATTALFRIDRATAF